MPSETLQQVNRLFDWGRKNPRVSRFRAAFAILTVIFLTVLLREIGSSPGMKTALQVDFENYVAQYEQPNADAAELAEKLPRIHVIIQGADVPQRELLIDPHENQNSADRVARMLSLSRESGVFGLNRGANLQGDGVVLRVEDGTKEFITSFSRQDIESNIKVESLLKLLTVHGKPIT